MEHAVPLENFQRENGTTFSEVQFCPKIFQWNEPKNHARFTTQAKFPESLKLDFGDCLTFSVFVILLTHDFEVNTLKKPLKCVYLCKTALKLL